MLLIGYIPAYPCTAVGLYACTRVRSAFFFSLYAAVQPYKRSPIWCDRQAAKYPPYYSPPRGQEARGDPIGVVMGLHIYTQGSTIFAQCFP